MAKPKSYTPADCAYSIQEMVKFLESEKRRMREKYPRMILEEKITQDQANKNWRLLLDSIRALELLDRIQTGKTQKDIFDGP